MNPVKRFFQEDIPAVFSAGKWRVSLMQLNARLSQLEKQKNAALNELGNKAWEGRVQDNRYKEVYSKLEELDVMLAQVQREIDTKQNTINQETNHLNSTKLDFDTRLKSTENQRQLALQKLTQLQANQKSIELRINQLQTAVNQQTSNIQSMQAQIGQLQASSQVDKAEKIASLQSTIATVQTQITDAAPRIDGAKMDLAANQAEQDPIKNEVDGYNQLINMLQQQSRSALSEIQENLKKLQQDLLKVSEKKNGLLKQMAALMPDLGNQVYRHHPESDALSTAYAKVDAVNSEIKGVNDQINLTQARLASVNRGSVQKVALAGGTLVFLLVCIVAFAAVVVPTISRALKPDPKKDIRLVESWTLENCSSSGSAGTYLDISVWENRRNDALASVELDLKILGSNDVVLDARTSSVEIAPDGLAVSVQEMNSNGSRVQEVTRSVSSAQFDPASLTQLRNIGIETFFEKTQDSNNVALSLELTNGSDFGLEPHDLAYAFVINRQNEVIDILVGNLNSSSIAIDSLSRITFQSLNFYGSVSCLQTDYSEEAVTFWYFVPLKIATNSSDRFTVSGKAEYSP